MANKQSYLGEFEHLVLLSILQLGEDAYGVTIRHQLKQSINRDVSLGALYSTIDRMEKKGLLSSTKGLAKPERGGKAKRMVKVSAEGLQSLKETKVRFQTMWQNTALMEV